MALLLVFLGFTLIFSFLCSVLEAVILSVTPSFVASLRRAGRRTGALLARLKDDVDRPLAAILTLNTIANTAGAAGVGAQARAVFDSVYVGITSAVLTFLVLFLSEIIPKTLGAAYWRRLAGPSAWAIQVLIVAMYPVVIIANRIAALIAGDRASMRVSREEIRAIADLGRSEGIMEEDESRILDHVMRFGSLAVRDVMTPRTVIVALDEGATVAEATSGEEIRPSRIPVYKESIDSVTGYVLQQELLKNLADRTPQRHLHELRRDIVVTPESQPLRTVFTRLLRDRENIALVVDEYGGTAGIVTVEDIVETLLGLEIVDETDRATDMQELARRLGAARVRSRGLGTQPEEPVPFEDRAPSQ